MLGIFFSEAKRKPVKDGMHAVENLPQPNFSSGSQLQAQSQVPIINNGPAFIRPQDDGSKNKVTKRSNSLEYRRQVKDAKKKELENRQRDIGAKLMRTLTILCSLFLLLFVSDVYISGVEQTVEHQSLVAEEARALFEGRPVEHTMSSSKRKQLLAAQLQARQSEFEDMETSICNAAMIRAGQPKCPKSCSCSELGSGVHGAQVYSGPAGVEDVGVFSGNVRGCKCNNGGLSPFPIKDLKKSLAKKNRLVIAGTLGLILAVSFLITSIFQHCGKGAAFAQVADFASASTPGRPFELPIYMKPPVQNGAVNPSWKADAKPKIDSSSLSRSSSAITNPSNAILNVPVQADVEASDNSSGSTGTGRRRKSGKKGSSKSRKSGGSRKSRAETQSWIGWIF